MAKQTKPNSKNIALRIVLSCMLLVVAGVVLARNWTTVQQSLHVVRHASVGWVIAAIAGTCITFLIAAAIYNTLALQRLRYKQTVLVEVSTAFVNRLLPAGLGGLGVHGVYLYKRGHTAAEATAVVSVNNLLGMTAHLLLLAIVIVSSPSAFTTLSKHFHLKLQVSLVAGLAVVLMLILVIPAIRRKLVAFGHHVDASLRKIGVARTTKALLLAMLLTATYTSILYMSTRALAVHISVIQVFVVFSIGMLFSTATPTPGGLVGAEAGLYAGLVGYSVSAASAGAIVLLYRLATYWTPLVPGLSALYIARSRKLL